MSDPFGPQSARWVAEFIKDRYRLPPDLELQSFYDAQFHHTKFYAVMRTIDVYTNEPAQIGMPMVLDHMILDNTLQSLWPTIVDDTVKRLITCIWNHELDEWFLIDGKHARQPHP